MKSQKNKKSTKNKKSFIKDFFVGNKRRLLKITLYSTLFLAVVFVALNLFVIIYGNRFVMSQEEAKEIDGVDCIIVLGAAVYEDGSMSSVLTERVNMGKSLYGNGVSPKILLSGDHSRKDYDEVNAMKNHLLDGGYRGR